MAHEFGGFRGAAADGYDDVVDFFGVFKRFKHIFDDGFAADFNQRFLFGNAHAGAFRLP